MVDEQVGFVLDALESSKYANNTFIIFTADHGDGYGRHKMVNKQYLYEDVTRVPFVICLPPKYKKVLKETLQCVIMRLSSNLNMSVAKA
jgi:arylsulfatase A-like enzyme